MPVEVLQITHCNVNCADLERSLRFYRDLVGLEPLTHTNPVPQDGAGFGMDGSVQWDAYMVADARGQGVPVVDLLEWKQPKPVGRPYAEINHLGFSALCLGVPDVAALHAELAAAGVPCVSAPVEIPLKADERMRAFFAHDPDGTRIGFIEDRALAGSQLARVNVNVSDLARSLDWYQRALALEVGGREAPERASGAVFGLPGDVRYEAAFLRPKGRDDFGIDLCQWRDPAPVGAPYASANHLGIYRMALLVEDIQAAIAELHREGIECPDAVFLDMGPDVPVDGVWACFFADPDGTCVEFIEAPKLA